MLIIRRKAGEAILLGDDIEIEIIDVAHNRVKLGIKAPAHVTILRKEVRDTGEQNRTALAAAATADQLRGLAERLRALPAPEPR